MASSAPDYTPIYQAAGQEWNVDPALLQAVAGQEAGGVSNVSPAGAQGHMQIMPATQADLGVTDPNNVEQSIYGGAKYLSQLLDKYGDPQLAVAAYNAGPGRVDAHLATGAPLPAETVAYVPGVINRYQAIQAPAPAADDLGAKMAAMRAQPAPTQPPANDAFTQTLSGPAPTAPQTDAFSQTLAGAKQAGAPDAFTQSLATAQQQAAPPPAAPVYTPPAQPGASDGSPELAPPEPGSVAAMRSVLAPAPNTTYGAILPLAKDNTTGDVRLALPSSVRDLGTGVLDLLAGPTTGQVTPAATNALIAGMTGGAGEGVANALTGSLPRAGSAALREGVSLIPGKSTYLPNQLVQGAAIANENGMATLAANPFSADFLAKQQAGQVPVAQANPLAAPTVATPVNQAAASITTPNPLAQGAAPTVAPSATGPSSAIPATPPISTSAASAAIPEVLPAKPILPIVTQKQADARADQIIQHFAGQNNLVPNATTLVPGSNPTLAQATGNPGLATLERGFQSVNPGPFADRAAANAGARSTALGNIIGSPADIQASEAARDAATSAQRQAAFANTTPVDPSPVVAQIDSILSGPQGQRPGVAGPLNSLRNTLVQTDPQTGVQTLQTDPQQLWGVRQFMNDMISPKAAGTPSDGRMAAAQLSDLKATLDPIIESGAPGFQKFLNTYSEASTPIDGMRYLQSLNLTDANGNTTLAKLDSAVKGIEKQQAQNGQRAGDSVSDDQLASLKYLRDDMRRESQSGAGKSLGSNTFQNMATNALTGTLGSPLVQGLSGAGAGAFGGLPGAIAGYAASKGINSLAGRGERMVQQALMNRLLHPEIGVNSLAKGKSP